MQIGRITGSTRNLGAPKNWDPETDGTCAGLPIRDILLGGTLPAMESAWFPTPEEITAISAGAPVYLRVVGQGHPPVMLYVGAPPDAV